MTSNSSSLDLNDLAYEFIENLVITAKQLIESDPTQEFAYKYPLAYKDGAEDEGLVFTESETQVEALFDFEISVDWPGVQEWCTIKEFEFNEFISQINQYVTTWQLTSATKFTLLAQRSPKLYPMKGTRYFVDALFSKPTPKCPNPLSVAKVHFYINVSSIMPSYYPVMVTYRFEGYKTLFYALGDKALRSSDFQRFYIDTILHMKLAFYAEICKCRNPENDDDADGDEVSNVHEYAEKLSMAQQNEEVKDIIAENQQN